MSLRSNGVEVLISELKLSNYVVVRNSTTEAHLARTHPARPDKHHSNHASPLLESVRCREVICLPVIRPGRIARVTSLESCLQETRRRRAIEVLLGSDNMEGCE